MIFSYYKCTFALQSNFSLFVFSYDIERQEVIELPSQTESVPIKFMNNNQPQIPLMISKVPAKEDAKEFSLINDPSKKNTLNENTAKVENLPKEDTPEENVTLFDVRSDQIPNDDQTDK